MKNIVCLASVNSVGCTFLDWSIHFLSGQDHFYSVDQQAWIPLSLDPVTQANAHGHKKNHPSGYDLARRYLEQLATNSNSGPMSIYPCVLHADTVASLLNIDTHTVLSAADYEKILKTQRADYAKLLDHCLELGVKLVYVPMDSRNILYLREIRSAKGLFFKTQPFKDMHDHYAEMDQVFFANSEKVWKSAELTNIWDRREQLALNLRPFDRSVLMSSDDVWFDQTQPHLSLNAQSLWYHGQHALTKVMQFLDLTIDPDRWHAWQAIYAKWQQIQLDILEFEFNYQHIVDAIVNNWYYDLGDLTFTEEVIIQHCLIYQHGLNLKTWQLSKFPSNAQDLHKLLETNHHPVESIY
jgi:hypothetical protein